MRAVYAHKSFNAEDRALHTEYTWGPGSWRNLRDEFAAQIAADHPDVVCLLEDGERPDQHRCKLGRQIAMEEGKRAKYETTNVEEPDADRMMRPAGRMSAQRRKLLRQARKRSITARRQTAGW